MNNQQKNRRIIIVVIALAAVVLITMISIFANRPSTIPTANINNISELGLPDNVVASIERSAYAQLSTPSNVELQSGSSHIFPTNDGSTVGIFTANITDASQTLLVLYSYGADFSSSNDSVNITIFCPDNSTCENASLPPENTLYLYIPSYETKLSSGEKILLAFSSNNTVQITISSCHASTLYDAATMLTKQILETASFDPNDFTFNFNSKYDNCLIK